MLTLQDLCKEIVNKNNTITELNKVIKILVKKCNSEELTTEELEEINKYLEDAKYGKQTSI
jgi:hypothetical protein